MLHFNDRDSPQLCRGCGRVGGWAKTPTIWGLAELCGPCQECYRRALAAAVERFNRGEAGRLAA